MKETLRSALTFFTEGTAACAIAHNLEDLTAVPDLAVLQEASKTGGVLMVIMLTIQKILERDKSLKLK